MSSSWRETKIGRGVYKRGAGLELRYERTSNVEAAFDVCVEHLVQICIFDVDCGFVDTVYASIVEDVIDASVF
jgi:hypothetical protein